MQNDRIIYKELSLSKTNRRKMPFAQKGSVIVMDAIDKKIIKILSKNAHTTSTDIGTAVGLSVPAVNKRIAKLKESGTVKQATILTDAKAVEKPVMAYILLAIQYGDAVENLLKCIDNDEDVLECYAVTGEYDYIIKACAASVESLENKLLFLKKQKGVMKSQTMLSLIEHKFTPTVLPNMEK